MTKTISIVKQKLTVELPTCQNCTEGTIQQKTAISIKKQKKDFNKTHKNRHLNLKFKYWYKMTFIILPTFIKNTNRKWYNDYKTVQ